MRVNILQHTPNEGPGAIADWCHDRGHEMYVYHPYQFGKLPEASETDMLVILGGPMSPNDDLFWIKEERVLITQLLASDTPIFGACYGAQQIAKVLGSKIGKAPHKEVGWAPVYLQNHVIDGLPEKIVALHWHEEMFEIPTGAHLLYSSDLVKNQGFVFGSHVIGLQFHFEPLADNVREMVVNDGEYALQNNDLKQSPSQILQKQVPSENKQIMYKLLDFITKKK
ncbi:type 1 glutamine amidotransferase [Lactobacillus jensenii]|uniref:Type 1 glutamine amidotransferase n=2 Tax=Lactobacillus jensenii TaxID=109790 RepID=A0ABU9FHS5_LACJE|nr:type 1 glutamine amidotransferase [Lactobacillus jensenii]MDT9544551.1 type 1 glutamine amidotransferase [Lactobacillus jensenii]